ncbi:MAG: hypothetical protein RSC92_04390, partial [Clostridia bacterium]
ITDRLYGKYDNLLITSGDGETNFFGETELINELNEKFPGGWSGGTLDKGNGFWGGYANQKDIKDLIVNEFIEKELPVLTTDNKFDPSTKINKNEKKEEDLEK